MKKYIIIILAILIFGLGCFFELSKSARIQFDGKTETITIYRFDNTSYIINDAEEVNEIIKILLKLRVEETNNPELEGCYSFEIQTDKGIYDIALYETYINVNGKFYSITNNADLTMIKNLYN